MLTRMKLQNFKSWRELDIEFAPLTVLTGMNSSGKSSILQALVMFQQTVFRPDKSPEIYLGGEEAFVDFGSYRDVIFGHDEQRHLGIELHSTQEYFYPLPPGEHPPLITRMVWHYEDGQIGLKEFKDGEITDRFRGLEYDGTEFVLIGADGIRRPMPYEGDFFRSERVNALARHIFYLSADRQPLKRVIQHNRVIDFVRTLPGPRGGHTNEVLLDMCLFGMRHEDGDYYPERDFQESGYIDEQHLPGEIEFISKWLKRLQLAEGVRVREVDLESHLYAVEIKTQDGLTSIVDAGRAVIQLLPVIILLLETYHHQIVVLERPELYLHPAGQAALADLLVFAMDYRRVQVIVETHSEYLLTRLRQWIAERKRGTPLRAEKIRVYFCQSGARGSEIQAVSMES